MTATAAMAQPGFIGPDLSGQYRCEGMDGHDGKYTATVTMQLVREHSQGKHGAYSFVMEVPGFGRYPGHAVADGTAVAIYFANADATKYGDAGTGLAQFKRDAKGQWSFRKYYYQPDYKGGNHGTETCTQG